MAFEQWDEPRRTHPVSPVLDAVTLIRQAILPIAAAALGRGIAAALIVLGVIGFARMAAWRRRTYVIAGGALRLHWGVFQRHQRVLPLERIQEVDLSRKLRHRLFGVVRVSVQAGGGGQGAEIELDAVSEGEAERLRQALLAARAAALGSELAAPGAAPVALVPVESTLLAYSAWDAVLAGVTESRFATLFAGIGFALQGVEMVDDSPGAQRTVRSLAERVSLSVGPATVLLALVAFAAIWVLVGVVSGLFNYSGLTVRRRGNEIVVSKGLLDHREVVVPVERVQAVHLELSPLRRPFGLTTVVVQSAGSVTTSAARVSVPAVRRDDLVRVVDLLLGPALERGTLPPLASHPPAALRRAVLRRGVRFGVLGLVIGATGGTGAAVIAGAGAGAGVGALLAIAWYRNLATGSGLSAVVHRSGTTTVRTRIVRTDRVQSTAVRSSPLQRRRALVTAQLHIAGRPSKIVVPDVHEGTTGRWLAMARHP